MNSKLLLAWFILLFSGCIREKLEECQEGGVKINIYAEKFQATSHNLQTDMESSFGDRIKDMQYFLYRGNALVESGKFTDCASCSEPNYLFERDNLPFGSYMLMLIGNCSASVGDSSTPAGLVLSYPGVNGTEDYFTACFPFAVDCDCQQDFTVCLERVYGVIRYTFKNLPLEATEVEMTITHVNTSRAVNGKYTGDREVVKRFPVKRTRATGDVEVIVGTFPTTENMHSAYKLRIYQENMSFLYDAVVTDTLSVRRNQLLNIATEFQNNIPDFSITVDTSWESSNNGGSSEID